MKKDLKTIIKYIDNIDYQLLNLISQRAICAKKVAKIKSCLSKDPKTKFYSHVRENQVLRNIIKYNKGPLSNKEISILFREIRSACLALELPITVAYMGPEGTFTQQAVIQHFGKSVRSIPVTDVFNTIENKKYKYGVVPVENSTEGIVNNTLDSFINSNLQICGEVILSIHHNLMIGKKNINKKIDKIYSHQQSFAQCKNWLNNNYPFAKRLAVSSNAEASKIIKHESNSAAIAGEIAASYYSLKIIAQNIEDRSNNYTRFFILSDKDVPPTGYDKTLLMISINNKIGSFYLLIEPFYRYNIDILRITNRPAPEPKGVWNYIFFIEIKGHRKSKFLEKILEEIYMRGAEIKKLCSYPEQLIKRK
ncbi:P-protein [Candidatus Portiera aleyrodidarum]|uniref:Bifunctional chorismate mutase/prephenate dehydratase n=1 Tax=Candidatus Portiera aleyrodidarum TV TaxID=1297582 RepID=A0A8D3X8A0_9GAMM|nr:prephenate dehydratase [Candidatus Portiera aleyrodidarum]AGI27224.1 prephenate dehydratase [Candidatus Portiera aleyrodidarum TV]CEI59213.1 P-protein [Candidatus Portiera aleyrodidarum]